MVSRLDFLRFAKTTAKQCANCAVLLYLVAVHQRSRIQQLRPTSIYHKNIHTNLEVVNTAGAAENAQLPVLFVFGQIV